MFLVPLSRQANDLSRSFDRLFDEGFLDRVFAPTAAAARADTTTRSPALDVSETPQAYTVKLDLPGATKDDIKVTVEGRRVSVEASLSSTQQKKDGERVVYTERSETSFARSFTLPMEVDQAESNAKMEHGVLTLTLAKRGASKATQLTVS